MAGRMAGRTAGWGLGLMVAALALSACARNPMLVKRSPCPAVALPLHVGSLTAFDPPQSRDADAIAYTAEIVDLKGVCTEAPDVLTTDVSFTVVAQRRQPGPARQVRLPLFVALAQGGNVLVSKQLTAVDISFAEGQLRAEARGGGRARVHRSATALAPAVEERLERQRKASDADALTDPMSDPQVRAALRAATFEVLVGFQLDDASLAYNVAK